MTRVAKLTIDDGQSVCETCPFQQFILSKRSTPESRSSLAREWDAVMKRSPVGRREAGIAVLPRKGPSGSVAHPRNRRREKNKRGRHVAEAGVISETRGKSQMQLPSVYTYADRGERIRRTNSTCTAAGEPTPTWTAAGSGGPFKILPGGKKMFTDERDRTDERKSREFTRCNYH